MSSTRAHAPALCFALGCQMVMLCARRCQHTHTHIHTHTHTHTPHTYTARSSKQTCGGIYVDCGIGLIADLRRCVSSSSVTCLARSVSPFDFLSSSAMRDGLRRARQAHADVEGMQTGPSKRARGAGRRTRIRRDGQPTPPRPRLRAPRKGGRSSPALRFSKCSDGLFFGDGWFRVRAKLEKKLKKIDRRSCHRVVCRS